MIETQRAQKAIQLDPRSVDAQILLGTATVGLQDLDGAVTQIQTAIELRYGIARNRQILFVSAGPDGQFGSLVPSMTGLEPTKDNVYSYQPLTP